MLSLALNISFAITIRPCPSLFKSDLEKSFLLRFYKMSNRGSLSSCMTVYMSLYNIMTAAREDPDPAMYNTGWFSHTGFEMISPIHQKLAFMLHMENWNTCFLTFLILDYCSWRACNWLQAMLYPQLNGSIMMLLAEEIERMKETILNISTHLSQLVQFW